MSIWVFVWLLVSLALVYFSVWTIWIVLKQKQSWSRFAAKHKLRYSAPSLFTPPKVSGIYKGYPVMMFPCEHVMPDSRGTRKLMAIEVEMKSRMPTGGAVATGGMVSVVQELNFTDESQIRQDWWDSSYIVRSEERDIMEMYLSEPRLRALAALAKIRNAWMIFVFRGNTTILRTDTPDPLDSEAKIEKILHKMIEVAKVLELEEGESKRLKKQRAASPKERVLAVKGADLDKPVTLELEEEEEAAEDVPAVSAVEPEEGLAEGPDESGEAPVKKEP